MSRCPGDAIELYQRRSRCQRLDAGYDAEDFHRDIYTQLNLLPIIIRKPSMWSDVLNV